MIYLKFLMLRIKNFLIFKFGRRGDIYYIGGSDTFPPPLSPGEEQTVLDELGGERDIEAKSILIERNLRLVVYIARKFENTGINIEDLISIGTIGLIKAIDNFDVGQGVRFSTYGVPMIAGEIRRYLRDNSALRVSRSMRDLAYRALQARDKLTAQSGRAPTVDEIAKALGAERADVVFALDAIADPVSLSEPAYQDSDDGASVMEQIRDTRDTPESWLDRMAISDAVAALGERERRILSLRYYQGKTQTEVAREIHISQAQVSRLEKNALNQIRKAVFTQ